MEYKEGYTTKEYIAVIVAREIRDEDKVVGVGLYSDIIQNGIFLANLTHASNVVYSIGGPFVNFSGKKLPKHTITFLPWDYRFFQIAEGRVTGHDELLYMPGHRKVCNVMFIGGLQIDKYGNINNHVIGDYYKPKLRSSGPIGLNTFALFCRRYYIFVRNHDKRTFVEEVDFITAPGFKNKYGDRKTWGLDRDNPGPCMVITPKALLDFDEKSRGMRLKSVHAGCTVEEVVENTGFQLIIPEKVPTTPPPTEEELSILRKEIDHFGILRTSEPIT